ncbi:unnamed protein product [Rhizoctonia solani]|uniref:Uncharacterized protein n=1 Tax=Rhizoctonia solani TaxID=456999 RepID=A0A8H3GZ98_9AGAM|nr:unnamed protein product [Rhizoctonia solani]
MRFTPLVMQPIGPSDIEMLNWELRSGTYYGDFRTSALDGDPHFVVDRTQTAILGSSSIPPPTNFEKTYSFCVADPKQDLAVLVEDEQPSNYVRFHFHSLSIGQPHKLVEHPVLTVSFDITFLRENELLDELISTDPEVMGSYFIVNIKWLESDSDISETLLWNWRTGVLLARIQSEDSTSRHMFLNKDYFLVYSALPENDHQLARLALLVFRIPKVTLDHKVPPRADFCPSSYPISSPILILELPEFHPSWKITNQRFLLESGPLPGNIVYTKSATLLCSHVTTLSLSFQILLNPNKKPFYRARKLMDFTVFVNTHQIFAYLGESQSEGVVNRSVPSSEWGTTATRWFVDDLSIQPYGSQYILSTEVKSGEAQLVSILNFNTPVIKRHAYASIATSRPKRAAANKTQVAAVLEGTGLSADRLSRTRMSSAKLPLPTLGQELNHEISTEMAGGDMKTIIRAGFKDPVVSCLPYRLVTKLQRMPLHGHWWMHGEYLVGFPRRSSMRDENPPLSLYRLELPHQTDRSQL